MFKSLLAVAVLAFASLAAPAQAQTTRVSLPDGQSSVLVTYVGQLRSFEGESRKDFMLRAGAVMGAWTDETGLEMCSSLYGSPSGQLRVYLTTSHSMLGCAFADYNLPGWKSLDVTIHTHPSKPVASIKTKDRLFLMGPERNAAMGEFSPEKFSEIDFEGGEGYLVSLGKLRHFDGKRTVKVIGTLPVADPETVAGMVRTFRKIVEAEK